MILGKLGGLKADNREIMAPHPTRSTEATPRSGEHFYGADHVCLNLANQTNPEATEGWIEIPVAIHHAGVEEGENHPPRESIVNQMNEAFAPMQVRFVVTLWGEIPEGFLLDRTRSLGMDINDFKPYMIGQALNIVVGAPLHRDLGGEATFMTGFVVAEHARAETWVHEMGHVLGLLHTFTPIEEGLPCDDTGDRICDTGKLDQMNYMSYEYFRNHFTLGQYAAMRCFIENEWAE